MAKNTSRKHDSSKHSKSGKKPSAKRTYKRLQLLFRLGILGTEALWAVIRLFDRIYSLKE